MTTTPAPLGVDYKRSEIDRRDLSVRAVLRSAKSRTGKRAQKLRTLAAAPTLPAALDHEVIAEDRKHFAESAERWIARQHDKFHHDAYFVTIIDPAWRRPGGKLATISFSQVRRSIQRSFSKLSFRGKYVALGIIDIAWNNWDALTDDAPFWQPHVHMLVLVSRHVTEQRSALASALTRKQDDLVRKPYEAKSMNSNEDVRRVAEYISSKLLFDCQQGRNAYLDKDGKRTVRKVTLSRLRQRELAAYLAGTKPAERWVLAGLRRDGSQVGPVDQIRRSMRKRAFALRSERASISRFG